MACQHVFDIRDMLHVSEANQEVAFISRVHGGCDVACLNRLRKPTDNILDMASDAPLTDDEWQAVVDYVYIGLRRLRLSKAREVIAESRRKAAEAKKETPYVQPGG